MMIDDDYDLYYTFTIHLLSIVRIVCRIEGTQLVAVVSLMFLRFVVP